MNLSMRWLSDFVKLEGVAPREYSERMSVSGSKVEGWEIEGEEIKNVVVGKILSIEPHPDADKLVVCQLDVGEAEPIQIVTGATNVFPGAIVPVAKDKSVLPGGKEIRKGKLRGVVSNGMLCSLGELGLTAHDFPYAIEDGIFIMQEDCQIGQDIRSAIGLDDMTVEFEITSNRPDCLSVIGLARETAVTFGKELKLHEPKVEKETGDINEMLSVTVENPVLCQRYVARMVKNIKIEPSPRWLRERLRASGVRPINNIVDITNYVMLEYGHPMHAFDYKYVKGGKIVVRNAKEGESIMTLDGIERPLSPEMLAICDAEKPSAVAGVMGGEYSGIMDDTNTIVFEAACFNGPSIRTTAKKLGMRTESSARFEKGLDSETCIPAIMRACELVEMLGAGEVIGGMIDVDNSGYKPTEIELNPDWINEFIGIDASRDEMVKILEDIGCKMNGDTIIVPSFRKDLEHKADIAEEIARFYGYDKIPTTSIRGTAQGALTDYQKFERTATETLLAQGCYQISTYSFISPKYYDKILLPADSELRKSVTILNPLGEDTSVMRTIVIPSMMETLAKNYNNRNASASLFEIANEYIPVEGQELPNENPVITIGQYGANCDFFTLKGVVETLLASLSVEDISVEADSTFPYYHPGRCAKLYSGETYLGTIGEIHPAVAENYGIGTRVYVARLDCNTLFAVRSGDKEYHPLPKFPATTRDLALLCDDDLPVQSIEKAIRAGAGKLLEKTELFDIYKGKQIPEGKKSVAYNITMRSADRTLTDEDVEKAMNKILKNLADLGASIRG
ncbi:MAG: phenylalanine--tRNA ligase subunit beta [Oscillospiraceae bacterium]|nr:phenylalanine--tRNA ligase subunit beta [Oscillospiraceae bacterium]